MVALFVALTFVAAITIDWLLRRGREREEGMALSYYARPAVRPGTNVLVVDDEKVVCNSCKKILAKKGYNVDVALTAKEALKKVKDNGFNVVIADWKMPEIDGIEIAKRVKKENPNTVVIMITGYPSVESSIKALRSGVSDYVPKPFTPDELSDAVMKALEKGHAVPTDLVIDRLVEKGIVNLGEKTTE
jgi:DNA-binding NtrC family response regulator